MSNPLISVLMPVRNVTAFTLDAVTSVLRQSHTTFELIIVGPSNTDELVELLPKDKRIRVVARQAPGIIGALNTGLKYCTGEYIARMDSDDVCHPQRLETQLTFAQGNPHIGIVGACVTIFSTVAPIGNGNKSYAQWLNSLTSPTHINNACFIESPMPHPSLFAHKNIWQQLQGYRDMGWPEDYDLILRAWLARISMAKPEPILLNWREHPARLTHTDKRYSREAFIQAKAWAIAQPESNLALDTGRPVWLCGTGRNARYWHDALAVNGVTVLGFVELDSARRRVQKRQLPIITYTELETTRADALVISAITNADARSALNTWCIEHGMRQGDDYILGG